MHRIPESELILHPDGAIYHLHLLPEQLADTVITVGDPERVAEVSKYFDAIECKVSKREFITHTGRIGNKRLTVISTGIGTDNIDIVMTELDALVNIDLKTRMPFEKHRSLDIVRVGTSGSLRAELPVDTFVASSFGVGLDNLMHFYECQYSLQEAELTDALEAHFDLIGHPPVQPYVFGCSRDLLKSVAGDWVAGITLTCSGFYGPQGRQLLAKPRIGQDWLAGMGRFDFNGTRVVNFEMETSGIYGMASMLGHRALSCSLLLANRITHQFSPDPQAGIERLIQKVLESLSATPSA
ncbi:MAG: nucleoside phosphorylase [Saprospiraceae bacterium]|nr:nucleoside phosphorylase [Saprospiraceae bacterium]MDZ4704995.1 nucleoside phosphorylase [Saprospiraceae bacterium]